MRKQGRSFSSRRSVPFAAYERFDNENERLFLHGPQRKSLSSKGGLTALEAAWNVTNAIQVRSSFYRKDRRFFSFLGNVSG